jgi:hypothetical protein
MSSIAKMTGISDTDMRMIHSVLRRAGYDVDVLMHDERDLDAATVLLIQLVRTGEKSPSILARHLERSFGRSAKPRVVFASLLPQYAIQGLPLQRLAARRQITRLRRIDESDLQAWENEGGAPVVTPRPVGSH